MDASGKTIGNKSTKLGIEISSLLVRVFESIRTEGSLGRNGITRQIPPENRPENDALLEIKNYE